MKDIQVARTVENDVTAVPDPALEAEARSGTTQRDALRAIRDKRAGILGLEIQRREAGKLRNDWVR